MFYATLFLLRSYLPKGRGSYRFLEVRYTTFPLTLKIYVVWWFSTQDDKDY